MVNNSTLIWSRSPARWEYIWIKIPPLIFPFVEDFYLKKNLISSNSLPKLCSTPKYLTWTIEKKKKNRNQNLKTNSSRHFNISAERDFRSIWSYLLIHKKLVIEIRKNLPQIRLLSKVFLGYRSKMWSYQRKPPSWIIQHFAKRWRCGWTTTQIDLCSRIVLFASWQSFSQDWEISAASAWGRASEEGWQEGAASCQPVRMPSGGHSILNTALGEMTSPWRAAKIVPHQYGIVSLY